MTTGVRLEPVCTFILVTSLHHNVSIQFLQLSMKSIQLAVGAS